MKTKFFLIYKKIILYIYIYIYIWCVTLCHYIYINNVFHRPLQELLGLTGIYVLRPPDLEDGRFHAYLWASVCRIIGGCCVWINGCVQRTQQLNERSLLLMYSFRSKMLIGWSIKEYTINECSLNCWVRWTQSLSVVLSLHLVAWKKMEDTDRRLCWSEEVPLKGAVV